MIRKVDNLTESSSADELLEAIKELEALPPETNEEAKTEEAPKEEPPKPAVEDKPAEVPAEPTAEAPKPEKKDKFGGDYEKLIKSYEEGERWNHRLSEDVSSLRKRLDELATERAKPKEPEYTKDQLEEWKTSDPAGFAAWYAQNLVEERTKKLEAELAEIRAESTIEKTANVVQKFRNQYKDFDIFREEIAEELSYLPPEVLNNPKHYDRALTIAYRSVKGKRLDDEVKKAREEGIKLGRQEAQPKADTYVEGAGNRAPVEAGLDLDKASSNELFDYMTARGLVPPQ